MRRRVRAFHSLLLPPSIKLKMKPPRYTTEQIDEIIDRIIALRTRWLRVVETQLAFQKQNRRGLSADGGTGSEVAENIV